MEAKPAFEQAALEYAQAAALADYHRAHQGLPPGARARTHTHTHTHTHIHTFR